MKILIGAPVFERAWILPFWFEAIEQQDFSLDQIGFTFEASPNDEETIDCLMEWHSRHPEVLCFDININQKDIHQSHPEGRRRWTRERYHHMVEFRNNLLDRAISADYDRYFSLDTDVLLEDSSTISELADFTRAPVAASPLMFMTPVGRRCPSVMTWTGEPGMRARRLQNYPLGTTFQADVIMAAKMMSYEVYQNVRYSWHTQGEDLGWSANCHKQDYKLYSLSGLYAPHIMSKAMLKQYQQEGDKRNIHKLASMNL